MYNLYYTIPSLYAHELFSCLGLTKDVNKISMSVIVYVRLYFLSLSGISYHVLRVKFFQQQRMLVMTRCLYVNFHRLQYP